MASPTVVATATGDSGATNVSDHPITLPTGTGKVIVLFACDGGTGSEPVTSSPGWSRKDYQTNGTNVHGSVFESSSDSPGALTIQTVVPGSSTPMAEQSSHVSYRVGGGGTVSVIGVGSSATTTPDPPALTPAGGSADYMWLTGLAVDANPTTSNTITAPTGYATAVQRAATGSNGAFAAMTHRTATAASEDPGTWTLGTGEQHAVFTIAVAPVGVAPPSVTPGVALRITGPDNSNTIGNSHFNCGIGFRTDGSDAPYGSGHTDITPAQIAAGYEHPTYFVYKLNAEGKPCVEFSAPLNGGRTSANTSYARSELREFWQNNTTKMDFDPKSQTHWIEGWARVTAMTVTAKKSVSIVQAHSADDDTIMILTTHKTSGTGMELKLRFNGSPTGLPTLDTNYPVGREFYYRLELNGGQARVYYYCPATGAGSTTTPIATTSTFSSAASGWYFKAGSYNQTNLSTDPGGGTIKVQHRDLRHFHTGWTQPQVPYSTDVAAGGGGNPTVEVGATASTVVGDVFQRSAIETNAAAITGRSWQILSGPAGGGQIIGTGATLNWTPTTVGDYTISYTAAYAGGSATDTFTVTVTAAGTTDPDIPTGTPVWPSTFPDGTPYPVIGTGSRIVNVSTATQLQSALTAAVAGDRIRCASGTYSGQFTASGKRGTATNGISVEAATLGGAIFASGSTLRLTDCSHLTVVGLSLPYDAMNGTDTISLRGNGTYIHLRDIVMGPSTRTTDEVVAGNFVFVGDDVRHVRIDGCEFRNKGTSGNGIRVYGNFTTFEGCQYVRIDHNLFRDIGPEVGNDKEPVRLGVSTMSRTQGNHVCERNVFLRCQAEPECFSGKMGRIRFTGNVLKDCTGGPVLRHGIGSILADNYVIDTANSTGSLGTRSGGPRFYDSDHYVGYNTIQGTRGTGFQAALLLDTGDAEGTSTNLSAHWRVIRATVEKNWITDCATGIQVGDNYTSAPLNCVVTDNLVSNTSNTTAVAYAGGITASQIGTVSGNVYAATAAAHGAAQDQNGIWRKSGYGSRVTYLLSTDVGPSGNVDADADGTGNGTGTTGGGGGTTPDLPPSVEVGPAATVATGSPFQRSATESGANITLREWTIAQAPAGATGSEVVGTVIGSALTLNWAAPATLGTYVLRYTAANAAGVDSADLPVTVTAATVTPAGSPPVFVAVAGIPASGLQSIVDPDPPPGIQPGDFQICAIQIAGSETITVVPPDWFAFPGGGTVTSPSTPVDRGGVSTALMFYNTTGATDAVWEKSGTRLFQAVRAAWRGHTSVGEMKAVLEASGTGSRNHVVPPVRPVRANSRIVAVAMSDLINFSAGPWQAPAGWTPRYDKTISGGGVAAGLEYESITIADSLYEGTTVTTPPTGGGGSEETQGGIFLSSSEVQDAPTTGTPYTTAVTTADLTIPAVDFSGSGGTTRPVIRSSSTDGAQNEPTIIPAKPAGLAVGDLMLAFIESDSDGDLTSMTAPGWSNIGSQTGSASTDLPFCKIFRKVATSSDVAASTFAFPDNTGANVAGVVVAIVAGTFDATTPTTTPVWATDPAPANGQVIAPSVTGVVDGLLMTTHMAETGGTNRSWSANPAGMTLVNSARASTASYVLNGVWSEPLTSTSGTGTRTATCSGTPRGYAAASVIVNPATGTATPTGAAIAYLAGVMFSKLGTTSYKTKVDTALVALPTASTPSLVPLIRQLPGYLVAADLVGYHDSAFEGFAALVRSKAVAGGLYGSITETSRKAPNYQGALSLAARAAASAYLNDRPDLDECATIFRRWTGEDRAGWTLWEPTADHDDSWVDAASVTPGWPVVSGNVFVAPAPLGSDGNSGLSDTTPKATIAAGINAATAGQVVRVAAGVYTGDVSTPKGGTAGSPIRVRSEDLTGAKIVGGVTLAHQWVTLEGFDVDGGGIVVAADNVQALNNRVHGGGTGQSRGIGGVAAPAGAILTTTDTTSTLSITTSGTVGSPRVYDGQGHTVGKIDIAADYVTVQNFRVRLANNSGIYSIGTGNTIQNNDIARVREAGTGDINAITFFGNDTKIIYNDIGTTDFVVEGDPAGSHTDGIQTWNTPSKRSSSNVTIQHNRIVGPGQSDARYIHQGVMAEGKDSTDGGGGGTGTSANWLIADNYFDTYGNQVIKVDDIDSVAITRNTFVGSCTKIVERGSLSVGTTYYTDNVVTGSFGSVGVTATAGPGPQGVGGGGGAGIRVDSADGLHSAMTGVVLDGNTVYGTGTGIYVSTPVTASVARNNLVFGAGDAGLYAADAARGWLWVNDTIAHCGRGIVTGPQFVVRNTIGYNNSGGNFPVVGTGTVLTNNLAAGSGGGSGITGVSVADPLFVNPSTSITTANYRPQPGSPAIGGATSTDLPPTDIVGVSRPQPTIGSGGTGDVGCYEIPAASAASAGVNGPAAGTIAGAIGEDLSIGPAAPTVNESALSQAWEALGAAMITAKLLERAGYGNAFVWGSSALRRAAEFLASKTPTTGAIPPAPSTLQWVPYAVNNVYGTALSPLGSNSARGNSVASADWIF